MVRQNGPCLLIRGVKGFLEGEMRTLRVGEAIVIGRSRFVDLSTRKAGRLKEREDRLEIIRSNSFLSVSRRHVRIHFLHPELVEVKDISSNGTFVDGHRVDCVALTDLHERTHCVALGTQERFELEIVNGQ